MRPQINKQQALILPAPLLEVVTMASPTAEIQNCAIILTKIQTWNLVKKESKESLNKYSRPVCLLVTLMKLIMGIHQKKYILN